jgi:hypothetical protein
MPGTRPTPPDSYVLADMIKRGFIDAVHIAKNDKFRGTLRTEIVEGKCVAIDPATKEPIDEATRLASLDASGIEAEYFLKDRVE